MRGIVSEGREGCQPIDGRIDLLTENIFCAFPSSEKNRGILQTNVDRHRFSPPNRKVCNLYEQLGRFRVRDLTN